MKALAGFVLAFWLIGLAMVVRAVRRWPPVGKVITITVPLTEPADEVQPVDPWLEAIVRRGKAEQVKWAIVDGFLEVLR